MNAPDTPPEKLSRLREDLSIRYPALAEEWLARVGPPSRNHRGAILWLTGLSGSGKTTLASRLAQALGADGYGTFLLDGDELRKTLCRDLGFSPADRSENIRRAGEVASLFARHGIIAIAAFISPLRADRDRLRERHRDDFHEIWLSTPLAACEARDVKGLYARARRGELAEFTGVSAPYEAPVAPDLSLDTSTLSIEQCLASLQDHVGARLLRESPHGK